MEKLEITFDFKGFQKYFIEYKKKEYKGGLAKC